MRWAPDSTGLWAPDSERRRASASDSDGHLTLIQAIDLFLAAKAAEGISPKTATWYSMILARLGRAFESDQGVDRLTAPALRAWIVGLQAMLAPVSIAGYVRTLQAFGNWLHARRSAVECATSGHVARTQADRIDSGRPDDRAPSRRIARPSGRYEPASSSRP
jgi:hypothetical protein